MKFIKLLMTHTVAITAWLLMFSFVYAGESKNEPQNEQKKVVMVVTSYGQQEGEERPGYEFDEFSKAYSIFKANYIHVDVASPKGGKVVADKFDKSKPYNVSVLADKAIMHKLDNTLLTADLVAQDYDAVFVVGGKGAMFDLPKDKALQTFIAELYQQQGSVAAVCHGPAALIDVKLNDGSYLVAGKKVNGFTNQEEKLFGKKWLSQFEFMLEDKLVERGGQFQSSPIMLSHVAVDERLVTGQNPSSTVEVALALVESMGLTPAMHQQDTEDKTMAAIAEFLDGNESIITKLASNHAEFHIPLVGMYGYYYLNVADSETTQAQALSLMKVAQAEIKNPRLDMTIAQTQHKLGKTNEAKNTLTQLLVTNPDFKPAAELLKTL